MTEKRLPPDGTGGIVRSRCSRLRDARGSSGDRLRDPARKPLLHRSASSHLVSPSRAGWTRGTEQCEVGRSGGPEKPAVPVLRESGADRSCTRHVFSCAGHACSCAAAGWASGRGEDTARGAGRLPAARRVTHHDRDTRPISSAGHDRDAELDRPAGPCDGTAGRHTGPGQSSAPTAGPARPHSALIT